MEFKEGGRGEGQRGHFITPRAGHSRTGRGAGKAHRLARGGAAKRNTWLQTRHLRLCGSWNQCRGMYFYRRWVFFLNNPAERQILNPEIVFVPVIEKAKPTGSFWRTLVMKCSGNSFSFRVKGSLSLTCHMTLNNFLNFLEPQASLYIKWKE